MSADYDAVLRRALEAYKATIFDHLTNDRYFALFDPEASGRGPMHGPWPRYCNDAPYGEEGPMCELLAWHDGGHEETLYADRHVRWDR